MTTSAERPESITFTELDPGQEFAAQVGLDSGPCTLLDMLIVPPGAVDEVIGHWRQHADYMKTQPGLISVQMHRAVGDGGTLINLAVWESPAALLAAVSAPEFAAIATDYPPGTVCTRQLLRQEAVDGVCVA
ncbi:antibiotic biosynthesis monooxygenase family protein [Streptomyces sp. NPDC000618]|uniref:antibiotic biosynthesis monooxygenase family protein n=1 Tax=Streptomyces sp. NPDC000618 TaxID=3154265 RepID=UPI003316A5B5